MCFDSYARRFYALQQSLTVGCGEVTVVHSDIINF